ncbi:MAG: hypothetical protein H6887_11945 [Hoeflea sp.]|nr:hypothetical protein [Hoeflea sp.]
MSSSDEHGYITFGWIATICFLLLFAATEESQRATVYQSSYYQEQCANQHPDSPLGAAFGVSDFGEPKSQKGNAELDTEPDWCDLAAQQSVAEDTARMRRIAWYGFFTGVAGVTLLIWTLMETRNSVAVAREMGQKQTRAYLALKLEAVTPPQAVHGDYPQAFTLVLRNTGQSPARNVNVGAQAKWMARGTASPCADLVFFGEATKTWPMAIPSQGTQDFEFSDELCQRDFLAQDTTGDSIVPTVFGIVFYDDVFGNRHKTRFAYFVETMIEQTTTDGIRLQRATGVNITIAPFHNDED